MDECPEIEQQHWLEYQQQVKTLRDRIRLLESDIEVLHTAQMILRRANAIVERYSANVATQRDIKEKAILLLALRMELRNL